jgi:hypothetical protein
MGCAVALDHNAWITISHITCASKTPNKFNGSASLQNSWILLKNSSVDHRPKG